MIRIKRVYEKPNKKDGFRILVDRLWPRGVSKKKARLNLWEKDISPSNKLRKWFSHDPKRWAIFKRKYKAELKSNSALLKELKKLVKKEKNVTLVYAAKDEEHNNALVLKEVLS